MRVPIGATILIAILLGACAGTSPPATPTPSTTRTLQQQLDAISQEATSVAATAMAFDSVSEMPPAVATENARRYQNNIATYEALVPTLRAVMALALPPLPDLTGFPDAPAPVGLAGLELPTTREGVISLVYHMPEAIAGVPRTPQHSSMGGFTAFYGEFNLPSGGLATRMSFVVDDPTQYRDLPPGWSAAHSIAESVNLRDASMERGRDGHLYWVRRRQPFLGDPSLAQYYLTLGDDRNPWLFQLTALTPEELEALAGAIGAAR